jgi:hypothetical protein
VRCPYGRAIKKLSSCGTAITAVGVFTGLLAHGGGFLIAFGLLFTHRPDYRPLS